MNVNKRSYVLKNKKKPLLLPHLPLVLVQNHLNFNQGRSEVRSSITKKNKIKTNVNKRSYVLKNKKKTTHLLPGTF